VNILKHLDIWENKNEVDYENNMNKFRKNMFHSVKKIIIPLIFQNIEDKV
jgi:hypothetical protein